MKTGHVLLLGILVVALWVLWTTRQEAELVKPSGVFSEVVRSVTPFTGEALEACQRIATAHVRAGDVEGGDFINARCFEPALWDLEKEKEWRTEYRRQVN
jgi:hypothetical protein